MCFGVKTRVDFVRRLGRDVSLNILMRLNDPADVVRSGAVSRRWRRVVVTSEISKQLCLRKFPQLLRIARITEPDLRVAEGKDDESSNSRWETLKRDHNVYAFLLQAIETSNSCPSECLDRPPFSASRKSFANTLAPGDRYQTVPSYWSSIGHSNSKVVETLIYKLKADLCVITDIHILPFEAYYHPGNPICSSVRFQLGHLDNPKSSRDKSDLPHGDEFIWTYTSEEFPMRQENLLQQFKLPESVLCIGGYLQIELLGPIDQIYHTNVVCTCLHHVKARGRPLSRTFGVQSIEPSGDFVLKYKTEVL